MVATIDQKKKKKGGKRSPRQLDCYTCTFSLPNVTNTKQTLKRGNKLKKYETLFTSMGMHGKCCP
jgi:hypothetical protein